MHLPAVVRGGCVLRWLTNLCVYERVRYCHYTVSQLCCGSAVSFPHDMLPVLVAPFHLATLPLVNFRTKVQLSVAVLFSDKEWH